MKEFARILIASNRPFLCFSSFAAHLLHFTSLHFSSVQRKVLALIEFGQSNCFFCSLVAEKSFYVCNDEIDWKSHLSNEFTCLFSQDEIYHNEAYANSEESSPDSERRSILNGSHSPQRNHSFIAAVISAIRSAATTAKDKVNQKKASKSRTLNESNGENGVAGISGDGVSEMLDSETEPCLMMENVLEDVSMPDSHTHNLISSSMVSSIHSLDGGDKQEDSLHNLCEAIANRQKIEQQTTLMMMNQSMHSERDGGTHDRDTLMTMSNCDQEFPIEILVDHVIDVDNLVTKLLKVLRIIQMDNDSCIQQLINEKYAMTLTSKQKTEQLNNVKSIFNYYRNALQLNSEETMDKLKDADDLNEKLKVELESKTVQLINSSNDLAHSHSELIKSRREINVSWR